MSNLKRVKQRDQIRKKKHLPRSHWIRSTWPHGLVLAHKLSGMKTRCYNKNNHRYLYYGGRGVRVCDEWLKQPASFYKWAVENGYKPGLSIDRIDCNGHYSPQNCRWATQLGQSRNKRNNRRHNFAGKNLLVPEISDLTGISRHTLSTRLFLNGEISIENSPRWKNRRPVIRSDGKIFKSRRDAQLASGISSASLQRALRTGISIKGFHFKKAEQGYGKN